MSPSQKKQTPMRFTPQMRERLDAEVARTGLSINAIVHQALDAYLPRLDGARPPAEPKGEPTSDTLDFD